MHNELKFCTEFSFKWLENRNLSRREIGEKTSHVKNDGWEIFKQLKLKNFPYSF